jgi:hypothetical protein
MIDNVVGVLEWHITEDCSKRVEKYADEDDPGFTEHHLRTFLMLLLATLTCSDPKIKRMHKDVIREILTDYQAKMKENYPSKADQQ